MAKYAAATGLDTASSAHSSIVRASAAELRLAMSLLEQLVVPAFVLDPECRVIIWNRACERLTGLPAHEVMGTSEHWRGFYDQPRPCLADLVALGRTAEIDAHYAERATHDEGFGCFHAMNWCVMPKLGTRLYLAIDAGPIYDETGRLLAVVETLRDVTAAHRAEEALREAQADLKSKLLDLRDSNRSLAREAQAHRRTERDLREQHARLEATLQEIERFQRDDRLLVHMPELLQSCTQRDEAYAVVREVAGQLFPGVPGSLHIFRESRDTLEHVAAWGDAPPAAAFHPDECWALRLGGQHVVTRGGTIRCRHVPAETASYVCITVQGEGRVLGLLHLGLELRAERGGLSREEQRRLRSLAERVGPSLANLRLRDSLRDLALHDPLTGLYNRRYLDDALRREICRVERTHEPLSLIMIDIDHFKRFNDTFGHDAGDFVLAALARLIVTGVRPTDIACRYGGEEIAIVLPGITLQGAATRAEELRAAFHDARLTHQGQLMPAPTASFGISTYPLHGANGTEFLKAADQALYLAKQSGRDQVRLAATAAAA
jgi:diguanylate cyclase (GGDEF)-like protein/PAS domain S-box-containing protein